MILAIIFLVQSANAAAMGAIWMHTQSAVAFGAFLFASFGAIICGALAIRSLK
jgi:hypothetical protein